MYDQCTFPETGLQEHIEQRIKTEHTTMRKTKIATTLLADCFGCHMSFLDIDEHLTGLLEHIEFSRSPLTDIKYCSLFAIGLIESAVCNAENVHVLRRSST